MKKCFVIVLLIFYAPHLNEAEMWKSAKDCTYIRKNGAPQICYRKRHTHLFAYPVSGVAFKSVQTAPRPGNRPPVNCYLSEMDDCNPNSGPVCAIDDSGITKTFENKCMAYVMACQQNTFFVEVKPGDC